MLLVKYQRVQVRLKVKLVVITEAALTKGMSIVLSSSMVDLLILDLASLILNNNHNLLLR